MQTKTPFNEKVADLNQKIRSGIERDFSFSNELENLVYKKEGKWQNNYVTLF